MRGYHTWIGLLLFACVTVAGAEEATSFFPPVRESEAYHGYQKRSPSEISRILYLIDRFKGVEMEVLYDGTFYKPEIAIPIARWFLAVNYKKQTAEEWVKQYCTSTFLYGNPIRVKMPDNTFRSSRELLLEELELLKQIEAADGQRPV